MDLQTGKMYSKLEGSKVQYTQLEEISHISGKSLFTEMMYYVILII